jgi:hypothetical protein
LRNWLQAIAGVVDRSDVLVLVGLVLIATALWEYRPAALGIPGAVLVWYGLPTRPRFISKG